MEEARVHALDYLSVIRRRKWWLAAPIAASVVIGLLLVKYLPKEFKSTATVGVSAPFVSPTLVNQSASLDNSERLRALSQQLVSSTLLTRIAREEGLKLSGDALIAKLRKAITITVPDPVATTNEPRALDTFIIGYADTDPARAQRIANRLVYDFVDENSKVRAARAEDTSEFIAAQLKASEARLSVLEEKLRKAKEAHMGQLPEQTQANLQTLSGLRQQIEANATALRSEQDRLSMVEQQLETFRQGGDAVIVPRAGGGDTVQTPETRVMTLQRELATARATYTEKHPAVVELEQELAQAKRDAATDRAKPTSERDAQLQADPAYRQLLADREMGRLRVRELQRTDTDLKRQVSAYQARVEQAPMVEQQLASLQRDFDLEKQNYSDLSSKLHAATIAESVERNRRGEQFTVLYSASYPTEPTKPVPWRVMLMSIVGGIAVGGGLMLLREYVDRSVYSARDLHDEFELPVLGSVARIEPV